ncbi:cytochrome b [Candidatus Nucleicultrix amoebiphila]|jgi:cytochrome b561|uniref:Cytochrome b561 bacterial/Ni-hydrogenase domain-containing protein n=1 Tax=Candidatus Nucleicultrix amoebiphila FS5 TaxID=1414854 RepID=A0A1W6N2W1_9PROT|nr:cytochrome b [Candidatus Nucleicultrix amoebiphila]ARN84101.1 hypothetical protein GQ61_00675 [Candidatus Nucleicultrix amoebiphila FS5]
MIRNTKNAWGSISRLFHWSIGLFILTLIGVGLIMIDMEPSPLKWQMYGIHKATGVSVLVLVVVRLIWRLQNIIPVQPHLVPLWQQKVANISVILLYILMFTMPLSGIIMSLMAGHEINYFGLFTIQPFTQEKTVIGAIAREAHIYFSYLLMGLLTLHVLAALYHHFILKNNVLRRMLWGESR